VHLARAMDYVLAGRVSMPGFSELPGKHRLRLENPLRIA
jgi:hypothetical protein